jgi:hypothetical protein
MTNPNDPINTNVFDENTWGIGFNKDQISRINKGLTKREYFAAMAMQGMLASANNTLFDYETIAVHSVKHADALINALNR